MPFSIALSWRGSAADAQNGAVGGWIISKALLCSPKGNPMPSVKALTFYGDLELSQYAGDLQARPRISSYTVSRWLASAQYLHSLHSLIVCFVEFQIGPFQSPTGEREKLKVKARLNLHGIVSIESATLSSSSIKLFFNFLSYLFDMWHYRRPDFALFIQRLKMNTE